MGKRPPRREIETELGSRSVTPPMYTKAGPVTKWVVPVERFNAPRSREEHWATRPERGRGDLTVDPPYSGSQFQHQLGKGRGAVRSTPRPGDNRFLGRKQVLRDVEVALQGTEKQRRERVARNKALRAQRLEAAHGSGDTTEREATATI